ncbi:uncharacterized protein HIPP1 isoform X1 [Drosophila pseudoobscura]|uniref:Uncharacterized protein HIPP1 isoform X1 n=1 Tax=Drosophila pseudoobscura pseudoobscura TaxID=46245 RepID=A0A6I8UCD6_DROPS|nr:uncharacterized protein LOC4813075 isoform X1 [Drosophila pseudoobscura]
MMAQMAGDKLDAKEPSQCEEDVGPGARVKEDSEPNTAAKVGVKKAGSDPEKRKDLLKANGLEKQDAALDEMSSLELEIAEMHNIHPSDQALENAVESASASSGGENGSPVAGGVDEPAQTTGDGTTLPDKRQDKAREGETSEQALEEVDLIALLKGTDTQEEKSAMEKTLSELDNVDVEVTIVGEGQYPTLEVDDEEHSVPATTGAKTSKTSLSTKLLSKASSSSCPLYKPKLSPEQARAVALEQIADLKAHKSRRREPVASVVKPKDIVSTLNDDWTDCDSDSEVPTVAAAPVVPKKLPPPQPKAVKVGPDNCQRIYNQLKVILKPVSPRTVAASTKAVKRAKPATPTEPVASEAPTGNKRNRVPKIIWDPDVPETQKSFAQYASSKGTATPPLAPSTAAGAGTSASPKTAKPSPGNSTWLVVKRVPRTPTGATTGAPKPEARAPAKRRSRTPNTGLMRAATPEVRAPAKRRSQTPNTGLANGGSQKKKKVSEIDRLMGDEGAANMIQAVEHEQREHSAGETSNKPRMRNRAMTVTMTVAGAGRPVQPAQPASPKKEAANASVPKTSKRAAAGASSAVSPKNATPSATITKPLASDSWDYVYKGRVDEESMIMRRRSNSSYSSNASVNRLSLDNKTGAVLSDEAADANDPTFKFLKPENKANQRTSTGGEEAHTLTNDMKHSASGQSKEAKTTELVVLHKLDKLAHLVINVHRGKAGHTYTSQLLQKLNELLNSVAKNSQYNTVLLTVQGPHFCQGIDCQELVGGSVEKRKNSASQLTLALKKYLHTLATFPKPLVAGIVGNLKNLGVMQLPHMDYVVAADDCCFETNYAKIGQLPEGYALFHNHPKVSALVHSRLFLLGERLSASDLLGPSGFVDKTCRPRSVGEEALAVATLISTTTAESYRNLKKLNHSAINSANLPRMDEEFKSIAEQWATASVQGNLKRYLSGDGHL